MNKTVIIRICAALIIVSAYFALRSHTWLGELAHDDGLFLSGAQAIARGEVLYADVWDHKPPGVFLLNALPLAFFPASQFAVKAFFCLWLSAAAFLLFLFCETHFSKTTALLAALLFVFYTGLRSTIQSGGLTEECALLFVIAGYWVYLREPLFQWHKAILAGFMIGLAVQCRQTFVMDSIFLLGASIVLGKQRSQTNAAIFLQWVYLGLGMLAPEIVISAAFWLSGNWLPYFEASYGFNFFYVGPGRPEVGWEKWIGLQWQFIRQTGPYLPAPFFALAMFPWIPQKNRWMLFPLLAAFIGDVFSIGLSGEYYGHYYVQASLTCCLLLALAIGGIVNLVELFPHLPARWAKGAYAALCAMAMGWLLAGAAGAFRLDIQKVLDERDEAFSAFNFQREVADAVSQMTYMDDRILLIGRMPNSVYFLANRLPGSRYYHFSPLWKDKLQGAVQNRHRMEFISDIQARKPVLLLLDMTRLRSDDGLARVEEFVPGAVDWIRENYQPLEEIIPAFDDEWGWHNVRLQILVLKERHKYVKEHYAWQGENPRVNNVNIHFRYWNREGNNSDAAM